MKSYKLGDVCDLSKGKTITRATANDGEIPVIGGGLGPTYYNDVANRKPPVITVSASGANAGFVNYWNVPIWASDCTTIVEKPNSPASINYIHKYLQSRQEYINTELRRGSAQPHVYPSDIAELRIPLPSLEKQAEIVEKLDSAFAEIEEAKVKTSLSVKNLSRLLDSKFEEVFKLMEVEYGMIQSGTVIDVRDGTHDSPSYVDSGYPLVTSKNLQDGLIDFSKVSLIKEDDYQKINKRSKVEVGDLLFAMIGTIGNPVVVKEEPLFAIKNVALFKGNPKYDMNFLSYYLRSPRIKEKFDRQAKGTTQRFLGLGYLRTFEIPNVPIDNQLEIVRKLEQFESELKKLEHNLKQRLESLIELNNSILSSFFTSDSEEGAVA